LSLVLDGTGGITTNSGTLLSTSDATISGLTVGKGGGSVATNTAIGVNAFNSVTTGSNGTAIGYQAGYTNTIGLRVSYFGSQAGYYMTDENTGIGYRALYGASGASGYYNVGVGRYALNILTSGTNNVAVGDQALQNNTTASNSVAIGYQAAYTSNTYITAVGYQALKLATGGENTALGYAAGTQISTGGGNTIVGERSGQATTTGDQNTTLGSYALAVNITGSYNIAIGRQALAATTASNNTAVGHQAGMNPTSGSTNTYVGFQSGINMSTGSKNTILGSFSGNSNGLDIRTASNYIVLSDGDGNPRGGWAGSQFFTGGVDYTMSGTNYGVTLFASNGAQVRWNNDGGATDANAIVGRNQGADKFYVKSNNGAVQNSTNSYGAISDIKVKENITDATPKLEQLQQVRIVNFNLINDTTKQIGVIAQELEQVFPSMVDTWVDKDDEGNDLGTTTKSVKYSVFVPMLVKAIQELKTIVDAQAAEIAELKAKVM
jgi:hypothetical protein